VEGNSEEERLYFALILTAAKGLTLLISRLLGGFQHTKRHLISEHISVIKKPY
jgi:hypothetical protein